MLGGIWCGLKLTLEQVHQNIPRLLLQGVQNTMETRSWGGMRVQEEKRGRGQGRKGRKVEDWCCCEGEGEPGEGGKGAGGECLGGMKRELEWRTQRGVEGEVLFGRRGRCCCVAGTHTNAPPHKYAAPSRCGRGLRS